MSNEATFFNDELYWHDGVLRSCEMQFDSSTFVVTALLFNSPQAKARNEVVVTFSDVGSISCTADIFEMNSNANAGNISNASIQTDSSGGYKLVMHLSDGLVFLNFKTVFFLLVGVLFAL